MLMTMDDIKKYKKSSECWICEKRFSETTRIAKYATIVT